MIPEHKFVNCAVCGSKKYVIGLGSCYIGHRDDLDLRTPLPIHLLIQHCDKCGYSAPAIEAELPGADEYLKRPDYKKCENIEFPPEYWQISVFAEDEIKSDPKAKSYYQYGLLMLWTGNAENAYHMFMRAAWLCDDEQRRKPEKEFFERVKAAGYFKSNELEESFKKRAEKADEVQIGYMKAGKACRKRATGLFEEVIKNIGGRASKRYLENLVVTQVDALRRSDSFEEAKCFAKNYLEDLSLKPLMEYQISLCKKHDNTAHTQNDVYDYYIEHAKEFEAFYEQHKDELEELKKAWEN